MSGATAGFLGLACYFAFFLLFMVAGPIADRLSGAHEKARVVFLGFIIVATIVLFLAGSYLLISFLFF